MSATAASGGSGAKADGRSRPLALRLSLDLVRFVKDSAREDDTSVTAYVRGLIEAVRTTYGLPLQVVSTLRKDAAALGETWPEYMSHVLFQRYEMVVKHGVAFDAQAEPRDGRKARRTGAGRAA